MDVKIEFHKVNYSKLSADLVYFSSKRSGVDEMKREILLVDDERTLLESLAKVLTEAGYVVRTASNGDRAIRSAREHRPDLVLLDVTMPGKCGFDVCRELRKEDTSLPIVFLTALDTPEAELKGLAAGGDLYIAKTTADEVLLARIAAVLRLRAAEDCSGDFDFGGWHVEGANFRMRTRLGRTETLTDREILILRFLKTHPGEVFSRDALITRVWGSMANSSDNAVSLIMSRLRKKLGRSGELIEVVYGVGYSYRP